MNGIPDKTTQKPSDGFCAVSSEREFMRGLYSAPKIRRKNLPTFVKKPGFFFAAGAGGGAVGAASAAGCAAWSALL